MQMNGKSQLELLSSGKSEAMILLMTEVTFIWKPKAIIKLSTTSFWGFPLEGHNIILTKVSFFPPSFILLVWKVI